MANEIQRLYYNSQASPVVTGNIEYGIFTLTFNGDTTSDIGFADSAATIQTLLEALASIGSGNITVTATSDGFTFEFIGALADSNQSLISASSSLKQKADTITINVTQSGSAGVNEIQHLSLGGATSGVFDLNGNGTSATVFTLDALGVQTACTTIWSGSNTNVNDLGGGVFSIEFVSTYANTNIAEMSISNNSTDGSPSVSTNTEGSAGNHHIIEVSLPDSPTEGELSIMKSGNSTNSWVSNAGTTTVENAVEFISGGYPCSVSGGSPPWTIESDNSIADPSWSSSNEVVALRKFCDLEIVTTQAGETVSNYPFSPNINLFSSFMQGI